MGKHNPARDLSYEFALNIVETVRLVQKQEKEYILTKQCLRSGTSIGANIEEAVGAQSRRDFISKMSISYKEARETHYWLRLMRDARYLDKAVSDDLLNSCDELIRLLTSIIKTSKATI